MKKFLVIFLFFMFGCKLLIAQFGESQWKQNRHELFFGAGPSVFMGDIGGSNDRGDFSLSDITFQATRVALQGGYSYKFAERFSLGSSLSYILVCGDDNYSNSSSIQKERGLHFKSSIVELSARISFSILTESFSHRYSVGARGKSSKTPNWYIYTGISGLYFNPKAQNQDGNWYSLQPLGTEGQGIIPTRDKYSRITLAIPIGMGIIFPINKQWGIGGEFGLRYTFTDYIDDVGSSYIDPDLFTDKNAKYFHNPTAYPDGSNAWSGSGIGGQRGNIKNNDLYMFFLIKITYKISSSKSYSPKF